VNYCSYTAQGRSPSAYLQEKVIIEAPMSIIWRLLFVSLDWLQVPKNKAIKALRSPV
jgi:hypothetical protein